MTIPKHELTLFALLSAATIAVAQMPSTQAASAAKPAARAAGKANLSSADKDFFIKAAQGGHAEVESSKLAASKAANGEVKSFAQQMVTDHTKAGDELTALATSKGVTVPKEPSSAQKAKIKALEGKTGADFDRTYAKTMGVEAHRETVALFKKTSASAKDTDVKAFATKTLPTLEHHLKMAEDLNKTVAKK